MSFLTHKIGIILVFNLKKKKKSEGFNTRNVHSKCSDLSMIVTAMNSLQTTFFGRKEIPDMLQGQVRGWWGRAEHTAATWGVRTQQVLPVATEILPIDSSTDSAHKGKHS